jgi:hypothetical protein
MNDTTTTTTTTKANKVTLEELAERNARLEQDLERLLTLPGLDSLIIKQAKREQQAATRQFWADARQYKKDFWAEARQYRKDFWNEARLAKQQFKAQADAEKSRMRMEAPEIAHHRNTSAVYGICTGILGITAVYGGGPVVGILAITAGIRTIREAIRWQRAVKDYRDAMDEETIVVPPTAVEIMEAETKGYAFASALHLTDAVAYSVLAMTWASPVFLLFAIIDGYAAMQTLGRAVKSSDELEKYLQQFEQEPGVEYGVQVQRAYA